MRPTKRTDNAIERLVYRAAEDLEQTVEKLAPKLRGGDRPPFTVELTPREQWENYNRDVRNNPEAVVGLVAEMGMKDTLRYLKQMARWDEKFGKPVTPASAAPPPVEMPPMGALPLPGASADLFTGGY